MDNNLRILTLFTFALEGVRSALAVLEEGVEAVVGGSRGCCGGARSGRTAPVGHGEGGGERHVVIVGLLARSRCGSGSGSGGRQGCSCRQCRDCSKCQGECKLASCTAGSGEGLLGKWQQQEACRSSYIRCRCSFAAGSPGTAVGRRERGCGVAPSPAKSETSEPVVRRGYAGSGHVLQSKVEAGGRGRPGPATIQGD